MKTKKKQKKKLSGWIGLLTGIAAFLVVIDVAAVLYLSCGRQTPEPEAETTEVTVSPQLEIGGNSYDPDVEEIEQMIAMDVSLSFLP